MVDIKTVKIRPAQKQDCRIIAELALIAGEGIPAFFWAQSRTEDQSLIDVGASRAENSDVNFSFTNTLVATLDENVVAMVLGYVLPEPDPDEDLQNVPDFIRPLIELEHLVTGSFYINMLATFAEHRGRGIGCQLMNEAIAKAKRQGCTSVSLQVFEQNTQALNLYLRMGFDIKADRIVIPHACHPYTGKILLLVKNV